MSSEESAAICLIKRYSNSQIKIILYINKFLFFAEQLNLIPQKGMQTLLFAIVVRLIFLISIKNHIKLILLFF
jgi:hypothetical protein